MIKAYTDINQSKMLAEILPLDSADMYYINGGGQPVLTGWVECEHDYDDIPCWSLAALLDQLTTPLISHRKNGKWSCYDFSGGKTKESYGETTAVDGCVKLICEINNKAKN